MKTGGVITPLGVWINPWSLTNQATRLYKCNDVADLKHAPPHMFHPAEFGRSALKGVSLGMHKYRRTPKIGERCNSAILG